MKPVPRRLLVVAALALVASVMPAAAASAAARRSIVATPSGPIELLSYGRGPAIVMLPSGGRGAEDFTPVARLLAAKGFRVLTPQPRGAGRSFTPPPQTKLDDLAEDVSAVIRSEVHGPVILVGHAFGGFVARMVSARHPELVRGLVLAAHYSTRGVRDTARQGKSVRSSPTGRLLAMVHDHRVPEADRRRALSQLFFADGHDPGIWLDGWWPATSEAGAQAMTALPGNDDWTLGGTAPVLDIVAADDPLRPAASAGEEVAALGAARVTSVVIPNAKHALMPEQPQAVANAIAAWARALPPPRADRPR